MLHTNIESDQTNQTNQTNNQTNDVEGIWQFFLRDDGQNLSPGINAVPPVYEVESFVSLNHEQDSPVEFIETKEQVEPEPKKRKLSDEDDLILDALSVEQLKQEVVQARQLNEDLTTQLAMKDATINFLFQELEKNRVETSQLNAQLNYRNKQDELVSAELNKILRNYPVKKPSNPSASHAFTNKPVETPAQVNNKLIQIPNSLLFRLSDAQRTGVITKMQELVNQEDKKGSSVKLKSS